MAPVLKEAGSILMLLSQSLQTLGHFLAHLLAADLFVAEECTAGGGAFASASHMHGHRPCKTREPANANVSVSIKPGKGCYPKKFTMVMPSSMMSPVRSFSSSTLDTAPSMASAVSGRLRSAKTSAARDIFSS